MTTSGTFSFGAAKDTKGGTVVLVNGQPFAPTWYSTELEVAGGGQLYLRGDSGSWYVFSGGTFVSSGAPPVVPPPPSPPAAAVSVAPIGVRSSTVQMGHAGKTMVVIAGPNGLMFAHLSHETGTPLLSIGGQADNRVLLSQANVSDLLFLFQRFSLTGSLS